VIPDPEDTIVALASVPGAGPRGIVRLSGPAVRTIVPAVFSEPLAPWPARRTILHGEVRVRDVHAPIPAFLILSPSPRSYTGQDVAELHLVSCPPILDSLIVDLLNAGARAAQPGEFTLRAFLNGKKDLTQAEAVAGVIEAASPDELQQALGQMAGGVAQPLNVLRDDLLNLLADIEAGLDFTDEDIQFVDQPQILLRLSKGLALLTLIRKQFETRAVNGRHFRAALVGEPNAGKSSLFNALAGRPAALVSPLAGTTRDYVSRTITLGDLPIDLIDTAGWQTAGNTIENQAQTLAVKQARSADLLLWCLDSSRPAPETPATLHGLRVVRVGTKSDLGTLPGLDLATCALTGEGLDKLKERLSDEARAFFRPAMASSQSRCQHHVDAALEHLRAAHSVVLFEDPGELLALELRLALEQIGAMTGAIHTEDLLGRIFSRFCIGK